jgi:hypothetical protein
MPAASKKLAVSISIMASPRSMAKTSSNGKSGAPEGHLKIIDRAKDVGKLNDGTLFRRSTSRTSSSSSRTSRKRWPSGMAAIS